MRKQFVMLSLAMVLSTCPVTVFAGELSDTQTKQVLDNSGYETVYPGTEYSIGSDEIYDAEIGMTYDELSTTYHNYLQQKGNSRSADSLNGFAQYAVDNGIISDTPQQRAAITKAIVRTEFKVVVAGGKAAGYKTAAALLEHSLQDNPSNLSYGGTTTYATQIANSAECKKLVDEFHTYVKGKKLSARTTSGSVTLNSTTDLHLAYNKMDYVISGKKTGNTWKLEVTVKDTYDFETQAWKNSMSNSLAVTAINNYAAYAQSLKAIVPYKVQVTASASFIE